MAAGWLDLHLAEAPREACRGALPGPPRGASWAPDGSAVLAWSADANEVHVFDAPASAAGDAAGGEASGAPPEALPAAAARLRCCEAVYDACWWPGMRAEDPATVAVAACARAHPLRLFDGLTGAARCAYVAEGARGEGVDAPLACCFDAAGARLFAGHARRRLSLYDVAVPGKPVATWDAAAALQRGVVGAVAATPGPAVAPLLAAGSYDGVVGVWAADGSGAAVSSLQGHSGGVTALRWTPDGCYLASGARRDDALVLWDVRAAGHGAVYRFARSASGTNQRVEFDVEPSGRHIVTGGDDGVVRAFDLRDGTEAASFRAADTVVAGFSFNPVAPLAATASGTRQFHSRADGGGDSGSDSDSSSGADGGGGGGGPECSLGIWRFAYTWVPADPA